MHIRGLIKYTHGYTNNERFGFAYMNMIKDMQMELQKPVTYSTKFEKWVWIWIVANWGIIHVDNRPTHIYPVNTGNNTALIIL
jgi:hypothetical protein